jgi:flagellar hook-associated protein 2
MATSVESSTSNASSGVNSSALISALGAGSGMDIKALAEGLVEAERAPRKDRIDAKIKSTEARISGYGAMKLALSDLSNAFQALDDARDFSSGVPSTNQTSALSLSTIGQTVPGSHDITVTQLATSTRYASDGFATSDEVFADDFQLNFSFADSDKDFDISLSSATPQSLVNAINAQTSTTVVSANLLYTGSEYKITLTGSTGLANGFSLSYSATTNGSATTITEFDSSYTAAAALQSAQDATLSLNGVGSIARSSNTITDLIPGLSINLLALTAGTAKIDIQQDNSQIQQKVQALVDAYNLFNDSMKVLGDRASKVDLYGGALAGDSVLRKVREQMRSLFTSAHPIYADPSAPVDPPLNANVQYGWQVGLSFDRNGKLSLDKTKLGQALSAYPNEVSLFFNAGTDNKSVFSSLEGGLAGNAVRTIDENLRLTGPLQDNTKSAETMLERSKEELTALEDRMKALLERYMKQFSAMESLVGNSNSLRDSLSSSFEGMMSVYSRK